jgi:hypothetical protein
MSRTVPVNPSSPTHDVYVRKSLKIKTSSPSCGERIEPTLAACWGPLLVARSLWREFGLESILTNPDLLWNQLEPIWRKIRRRLVVGKRVGEQEI